MYVTAFPMLFRDRVFHLYKDSTCIAVHNMLGALLQIPYVWQHLRMHTYHAHTKDTINTKGSQPHRV